MNRRRQGVTLDPVSEGPEGASLRVHVVPSSRTPGIEGMDPWRGSLVVRVKAAAEAGEANAELCHWLAEGVGVDLSRVTVRHGARSRDKTVRFLGVDGATLRSKLGVAP